MRIRGLMLIGIALLAGCASVPPRAAAPPETAAPAASVPPPVPVALGMRAAALAGTFVGTPYRFGGDSPGGFDCSGLVFYVYRALGLAVPRTASEQRAAAHKVPAASLAPGDLVFFYTPEDHVGIYVGNGEFVHAPASGRLVERARLDAPYFILGFAGAGRLAGS